MKYLQGTWTLPSSNPKQPEIRWDFAFLSDKEFKTKYGVTKKHFVQNDPL